jgi:hypothetical protein
MASVSTASQSVLQPLIASIVAFQAGLLTYGQQNGLTVDSGTTSPLYLQYAQLTNATTILLNLVRSAQTLQEIQIIGGSLYAIAAQFYQDVTQAFSLMEVNNIPAPWLSETLEENLFLPPTVTAQASSGISAAQAIP